MEGVLSEREVRFAPFLLCRDKFPRRMFSDPGGKFPGSHVTHVIQAENTTLRNRL